MCVIPYAGTTNSTPKRPLLRATLPGLIRVHSALVFLFIFKPADKTLPNRYLRFQTEFPGEEDARFSNERQRGEKAALPSSPLLSSFHSRDGDGDSPGGGELRFPSSPQRHAGARLPASLGRVSKTLFLIFPPLFLLFLSPRKP